MRRLAAYALGALTFAAAGTVALYVLAVDWFYQNPDRCPMTPAEWDEFARNAGIMEAD